MGDHAVTSSPASSPADASNGASAGSFDIPPQVLARWAALASSRAHFAVLPSQPAKV